MAFRLNDHVPSRYVCFMGVCYLFLLGEDLLMAGTNRIQLGSAVVTRVVEWQFELRSALFDQTPASGWQDNADLLVPTFVNPDTDQWRVAIQSWVIEVDGLTVVVDTGAGNGRQRPHMPALDHLRHRVSRRRESGGLRLQRCRRGHQHPYPFRPRGLEHQAGERHMGAHLSEPAT